MASSRPAHVLVVVHRTGPTAALLEAVRERVAAGPAWFHVLIPDPSPPSLRVRRAGDRRSISEAERLLERAVTLIEAAAHRPTDGSVSQRRDPMDAIEEALYGADFDEIILSTRRATGASRRLHMDLPRRVAHIGLPLATVIDDDHERRRRGTLVIQDVFRLRSPS